MLRSMTAALVATLPLAAFAQEAAKPPAEETKPVTRLELSSKLDADYADLDADKNGKVTGEEIKARLIRKAEADLAVLRKARDDAFAKLDTNGDGSISKAEFEAKAALPAIKDATEMANANVDRFDANKDGSITRDEYRAPTLTNFDRLDLNKDGTLAVAEQKATPAAPAARKKPAIKKTPDIGR
ncbi:MAG: EF-hand domain-containing protein [Pseudomonadota bacterium]|nr:EF-hand domain-containing protein [Pseudomonadota bacterium]